MFKERSFSIRPAGPFSKAQDITDPLNPVSIDGNGTPQIVVTDNGSSGTDDTIGITIWNKSGGLWFSSRWTGTATAEQVLGGENVEAR